MKIIPQEGMTMLSLRWYGIQDNMIILTGCRPDDGYGYGVAMGGREGGEVRRTASLHLQ